MQLHRLHGKDIDGGSDDSVQFVLAVLMAAGGHSEDGNDGIDRRSPRLLGILVCPLEGAQRCEGHTATMISEYVLRTVNDDDIPCGAGYGALKYAVDQVLFDDPKLKAGIIERNAFGFGATEPYSTTIVAIVSRPPILDLGERGHVLVTRDITAAERMTIGHYSEKLAFLDLSQMIVSYACRVFVTGETSEFKRGLSGIEAAVRCARAAGFGIILRRIEGIAGEQPIALCGSTGFYYTKSADESERQFIRNIRLAMEYYGEFPAMPPYENDEARAQVLEALQAVTVDDPSLQAEAFAALMGRIQRGVSMIFTVASTAASAVTVAA